MKVEPNNFNTVYNKHQTKVLDTDARNNANVLIIIHNQYIIFMISA